MAIKLGFIFILALLVTGFAIIYLNRNNQTRTKRSISATVGSFGDTEKVGQPQGKANENLPPFTFEDLWDPKFSYSNFYPIWVSSSQFLYRNSKGIQKYDFDTKTSSLIVSDQFYQTTGANGWSISNDEKFLLARLSYTKQWRHSYNASYAVYEINTEELKTTTNSTVIQYMTWTPTGHGLLWVTENNIHYMTDVSDTDSYTQLTDDGEKDKVLNGVPDWVYEEEMVSTNNNIFWSPDSRYLVYLVTNDTNVQRIEFTKYKDLVYPETISVAYPKAGTVNPTVSLHWLNVNLSLSFTTLPPQNYVGSDYLFCNLHWYKDSKAFLVFWLNRISNLTLPQLCEEDAINGWSCEEVNAGIERSTTGWIGNGGTPFTPKMMNVDPDTGNKVRSYFTAFSNDEGYWQVALVDVEEDIKTFLTNGTNVVTSIQSYDGANGWLYFIAAYPYPRNRNLFRIPTKNSSFPIPSSDWECMTCEDFDQDRCQWISPSFSPNGSYLVINCGGPDVPLSTIQALGADGNYGTPEVVVSNQDLIETKSEVKWPVKEYGEIESENGITILYQLHKPVDFDKSKKYPLLIEVYGGPGFQKVQERWTRSWAPIHLVSQYEIIVVSLDGRGSGYRGDGIAHMLYKKIGQLEKKDTIEVGRYFAQQPWVDEDRLAVWGWSYGGYTTTFTISEGSGVFKCGLAVAPLATRFLYGNMIALADSIHTERYMTLPKDNPDGYEKCSILNSNLENFKNASYSIIHGMADDNVHFQNAALISKALIAANVDFDNFYYADEAHSINTGKNSNQHVYKLLTNKIRQCFNLAPPSNDVNRLKFKKSARVEEEVEWITGADERISKKEYLSFQPTEDVE